MAGIHPGALAPPPRDVEEEVRSEPSVQVGGGSRQEKRSECAETDRAEETKQHQEVGTARRGLWYGVTRVARLSRDH